MKPPKEKSFELLDKYLAESEIFGLRTPFNKKKYDKAKKMTIICVDEIIESLHEYDNNTEQHLKEEFGLEYFSVESQNMYSDFRYWQQVKQELEKL